MLIISVDISCVTPLKIDCPNKTKVTFPLIILKLGLTREKALDKMVDLGYNEDLPKGQVIMVENPKKYIEEYIDELLKKKNNNDDLVSKDEEIEEVEINPIVKRQINSLKNSMKTYGLKPDHIMKGLKDDE